MKYYKKNKTIPTVFVSIFANRSVTDNIEPVLLPSNTFRAFTLQNKDVRT